MKFDFEKLKKFAGNWSKEEWDAFNVLSSKEKESFYNYHIDIIQETLAPVTGKSISFTYFRRLATSEFKQLATFKGYKKPFGAKSLRFYKKGIIFYFDDVYVFYVPLGKRTAGIVVGYQIRTKRGLHYVFVAPDYSFRVVLSSHFYDRLITRLYKVPPNRTKAMRLFFELFITDGFGFAKSDRVQDKSKLLTLSNELEAAIPKKGLALGTFVPSKSLVYLQTFISEEMLSRSQLKRYQKLLKSSF